MLSGLKALVYTQVASGPEKMLFTVLINAVPALLILALFAARGVPALTTETKPKSEEL
jgi:hypothetical protein